MPVRKQGVVVQTGLHPHENPIDWFQVTFRDLEVKGSWAYPTHLLAARHPPHRLGPCCRRPRS